MIDGVVCGWMAPCYDDEPTVLFRVEEAYVYLAYNVESRAGEEGKGVARMWGLYPGVTIP